MSTPFVSPPALGASADILVDWLELVALFSQFQRARLDDIVASFKTQREEAAPDFGDEDREDDLVRSAIESEFETRKRALVDAYPYELAPDGEELQLVRGIEDPSASFYLLCLIASHVTNSPILRKPPCDSLVRKMRNRIFQVVGTLAVAGFARGPAVSVGYPRESKESILGVLGRAQRWCSGLEARDKVGRHAAPRAKDGGIDVIGWPQMDRPPPPHVYFGQVASGVGWRGKPATVEYDNFMDDFFEGRGGAQHNFVTLIPFRVVDELVFERESKVHKSIFDRNRIPRHALQAIVLSGTGVEMDEVTNVHQVYRWLRQYLRSVLD
jgi:hypothetical protein